MCFLGGFQKVLPRFFFQRFFFFFNDFYKWFSLKGFFFEEVLLNNFDKGVIGFFVRFFLML